jgi:hypothetical protein
VKTTRLALGALALSAAIAAGTPAAPTLAAQASQSVGARVSQFEDSPWACHPQKYSAYGRSGNHKRFTYGPGGVAFYTIHYTASAVRCKGKTRLSYGVYASTKGFPSDRFVTYQLQSAGVHKKWKAACVKLYNSNKKRCTFRLDANKEIPIPGQSAFYQYRGSGLIRYARLVHVAEQGDSYKGTQLASKPQSVVIRLTYHRQARAYW